MKLRYDLVERLTEQDLLEGVLANNHRYQAEPLFSKTGVGSLSPASIEDRLQVVERSKVLSMRLKQHSEADGPKSQSSGQPKRQNLRARVIAGLASRFSTETPSSKTAGNLHQPALLKCRPAVDK